MHARARGVAADEVDHRLEVVDRGPTAAAAAAGSRQVRLRHELDRLGGSSRSRSRSTIQVAVHVVAGVEQLAHHGGPEVARCHRRRARSSGRRGRLTAVQAIPSETGSTLARPMEQPTLIPTKCFVRDLVDGQEVDAIFVVRARTRRQKRNGEPFLKLQLGDVDAARSRRVVWDGVEELDAGLRGPGAIVRVLGRYSVDERYGAGITVRALRAAAEGEYELADLAEAPPIPYRQMAADLDVAGRDRPAPAPARAARPALDRPTRYHEAPAAKYYHQAYRHGLLEHCLSVAQGVSALAATFPGIDRDVAVTGALLHDIGKVETYACRQRRDRADRRRQAARRDPARLLPRAARDRATSTASPPRDAEALLHIILSHHGKLEHGSPVVPCTREATLVHFIDNLGGNLGSFDRIEKALAEGAALVGLRPRDLDRRLLRGARAGGLARGRYPAGACGRAGRSSPRSAARSLTRRCSATTSRPSARSARSTRHGLFGDEQDRRAARSRWRAAPLAATLRAAPLCPPTASACRAELREAGPLRHGALLGAAVVLGELPNSALKRRLGHRAGRARRLPARASRWRSTTRPTSCSAPGRCWRRSGA